MRPQKVLPFVESVASRASKAAGQRIRAVVQRRVRLSKRNGSWFTLNVQERSILDLALKLEVSFRSMELMRAITPIVTRLREMGSSSLRQFFRGSQLASAFSEAAVSWGNAEAESWRSDTRYICFLGRFSLPARRGP